mgnify:CR=1 FL=1
MLDGFSAILANFENWGQGAKQLYGAFLVGSHARESHRADASSDLDLILVVDNPAYFLYTDNWLQAIGDFHISFVEDTFGGQKERRILFDGALDVDFNILPRTVFLSLMEQGVLSIVLGRGYRILVDKMGLQGLLQHAHKDMLADALPTKREYENLVHLFWYHTVWAAKKLMRGELWTAKHCVDCYMKEQLLSMVEWHARAIHGPGFDTWHDGRFLDEWAEGWVIQNLAHCFAHYDNKDIAFALLATMDLFRTLAVETAQAFGFIYPQQADTYATFWVSGVI